MANKDGSLAQFGYKSNAAEDVKPAQPPEDSKETQSSRASRQSWAKLIQKILCCKSSTFTQNSVHIALI